MRAQRPHVRCAILNDSTGVGAEDGAKEGARDSDSNSDGVPTFARSNDAFDPMLRRVLLIGDSNNDSGSVGDGVRMFIRLVAPSIDQALHCCYAFVTTVNSERPKCLKQKERYAGR